MLPLVTVTLLLVGLTGCGSATMAAAPRYTTSVLMLPTSHGPQVREVQFRPNDNVCSSIAIVRPDLNNVRCYDVLTLQLSSPQRRGRWTKGYASIRQCVARLSPAQLHSGCVRAIKTCANRRNDQCAPGETSQTTIEFRTDGKNVVKEWITCGDYAGQIFHYRLRYCGTSRELPPRKPGWLSVGDNYELDIPGVVQVGTYERFNLRADGALVFANCC